jgi:hypothetical protein
MYLGFGSCIADLVRLVPDEGAELLRPKILKGDGEWEIYYSIPYSFIRRFFPDFCVESGKKIRANCYKCGDLTVQEHYMSWNPVEVVDPDFHVPAFFGKMTLA